MKRDRESGERGRRRVGGGRWGARAQGGKRTTNFPSHHTPHPRHLCTRPFVPPSLPRHPPRSCLTWALRIVAAALKPRGILLSRPLHPTQTQPTSVGTTARPYRGVRAHLAHGARPPRRHRAMGQLCRMAAKQAHKSRCKVSLNQFNEILTKFGQNRRDDLIKEHIHQFSELDNLIDSFPRHLE